MVVVLGVAVALIVQFALPLLPSLGEMNLAIDALALFMPDADGWGVAASIGLMVFHSFMPFPAEFIVFSNGVLYGPVWGSVITGVGAMLDAFAPFSVARWFGRRFVKSIVFGRHRVRLDR